MPPLPDGAFSIVAFPDTQAYSDKSPEIFETEVRWVLDNLETQRIQFVTHLGDIVDKNTEPRQWDVAERCMKLLHGRVPYGFSVGNHDMKTSTGDSSNFQARFPESLFKGFAWYGGSYKNNANSWQTFAAAGMQFLIVHLECNAPDNVLAWADGILETHPKHHAIVTTHMYLGPLERPKESQGYYDDPKGRMRWKKCLGAAGNTPEEMWQECFQKHENLLMILAGDQSRTQSYYQCATGQEGNPVHELMSDYREGYLRVYCFIPSKREIQVFTYSPVSGALCEGTKIVPQRERHQFTLPWMNE